MKAKVLVDYHVHLEEGPYTEKWLNRTAKALHTFDTEAFSYGTKKAMQHQLTALMNRMKRGCYSEEWLDLYLEQAKKIGLQEVGIVDHLYRFKETKNYFRKYVNVDSSSPFGELQHVWLEQVMTEELDCFIELILSAKERWRKHGVNLKLGIEVDYFTGGEDELASLLSSYPFDYIIGAVHFVNGWGFDNPKTSNFFEICQPAQLYNDFFQTVEHAIRSRLFDFIAHLDNLKVFNFTCSNNAFMNEWYERIANALVETNTATEINAGLYYRYPVKEMCPSDSFLQILVDKGVEFTLSSDAHFPDDIGMCVEQNLKKLKNFGVQSILTFNERDKIRQSITPK